MMKNNQLGRESGLKNNQLGRESGLKSSYSHLYDAIECLMNHGDKVAAELATMLTESLTNFAKNEKQEMSEAKNQFRDSFVSVLHSRDKYFSDHADHTIQPLIHAIHKKLYVTLFLNKALVSKFSYFQEKTEQVEH